MKLQVASELQLLVIGALELDIQFSNLIILYEKWTVCTLFLSVLYEYFEILHQQLQWECFYVHHFIPTFFKINRNDDQISVVYILHLHFSSS